MVGQSSTTGRIMTMANYLVLILFIFCFNNVRCDPDNCNFGTCGECIGYGSERCVWCTLDDATGHRCRPLSYKNKNKSWCEGGIVDPEPKSEVIPPEDFGKTKGGFQVQFKPQLIKMKARPGVIMKFDMSFKPAQDFPLDVYYLMDVSDTMKKRMTELKNQAIEIHRDLSVYTNNVRLGIGSFVEKPSFPFFDPNKHKSEAFKNEVPLTSNMTLFTQKIEEILFGSNFDDPEAGLDALMQAMRCQEVGWRMGARRIIVLCTDSTYHSAGDGKIVGAIKPHDMKCHLKDHIYSEALMYDYPSVSQISQVAADDHFRLIFAITENSKTHFHNVGTNTSIKSPDKVFITVPKDPKRRKMWVKLSRRDLDSIGSDTNIFMCEDHFNKTPEIEYKELADQIDGAKYAKLEGRKNVINIIKDSYEELANSFELKIKKSSELLEVTIDQNCQSEPKINCESPHKQIVNITGTVKAKACPPKGLRKQTVTINPLGLEDKLIIELEVDCECECEKTGPGAIVDKCHKAGFLQCGICKCKPGSYGVGCRCSGSSTDQTDIAKCKLNPDDTKLCSGRGKCRCGKCEDCLPGFSGGFCEFDDNSCPRPQNTLCSGKGKCERGQCQCDQDWTGVDCSCSVHNSGCYAPYSKQLCSGKGSCVCGVCQCEKMEGKNETYSGAFCDSSEDRCKELENYAYCNYMHMNDKAICDRENNNVTNIDVFFVNKAEINDPHLYMAKWCKKEINANNGTYMVFKYQYEKKYLQITIQKELETPPEPNYWIAAGSAIGLVLLIGILTVIIWKILVDLHDKKEYQKFSAEAKAQGYDVSRNPLYQEPAVNFSNPVYNNQCS